MNVIIQTDAAIATVLQCRLRLRQVLPVPLLLGKAGRNPQTGAAVTRKVYQPTTTPETGVKGERK